MTRQKNSVSQVSILIKSSYALEEAEKAIESLLQDRHGIFEGNPNDFTIMNVQEILNAVGDIMGTFTLFLGGVAAISLLVGGIGIMNIMLVTVSERTREIGLRKALGAKNGDILAQFLVESSVISLVGGMLGIVFGLLLSFGIAKIAAMTGTTLDVSVNPAIIIGATLFSVAVGLFFGVYPANQASKLDPVIALRSE
jgi:putative ABC transport system permease protein